MAGPHPLTAAVVEAWRSFSAVRELGWNKALDAATHDDPAQRAAAQQELDWWVARAELALQRVPGLVAP